MSLLCLVRKDRRALGNLWRVVRREPALKVGFIALFAAGMAGGLFALFLDGFRFLSSFGGAGFMITQRLFSLFFFGLGLMLVASSVLTSYSSLFRSREVPFLLTGPFGTSTIVLYKFAESAALSSWSFFFVIAPFVGAYAWHERLGVGFGLWTLLFAAPFLAICSGLGMLINLAVVRWLPRGRGLLLALLGAAGLGLYVAIADASRAGLGENPMFVLSRLVPGLRAASWPWLPNWWAAEGIKALARGEWTRGAMFLAVLVSNAMLVGLLVESLGRGAFYEAWQRVNGGHARRARRSNPLAWLNRSLSWLPRDGRAIVMKDVRTFFRDPMQWSQALIFFGLLALYFSSIRSFHYDRLPQEWRNMIAFLNVFSVAAVQCSLASRFIYPQLSLEGHAFWVLGLAPTRRGRVLGVKFLLGWAGMAAIGLVLIVLSTRMLNVEPRVRAVALLLVQAVSIGICGLSAGLGAVFLDLKSTNPAAIVSGFGGTVNLVLSLGFMLAAILPFGMLFHLVFLGRVAPEQLGRDLALALVWLGALTAVTTAAPLWLGRRALDGRDF